MDRYKVEVIHYLNPYLLWIEMTDPSYGRMFEQVGIYGILPIKVTLDVQGTVKHEMSEEWMAVSTSLMKKILMEALEVEFVPTHIGRNNSIFDDNIHKFGELIVTRPSGKKRRLSSMLIKNNNALYDECIFHQRLSSGELKTKLTTTKTKEVLNKIEKYCSDKDRSDCLRKQTTVFKTVSDLESDLIVKSHQNQLRCTIDELMQRKLQSFELCKDIDEQPLGRGLTHEKPQQKTLNSSLLRKRLNSLRSTPSSTFNATKDFLLANARNKHKEIDADYDRSVAREVKLKKNKENGEGDSNENWNIDPNNLLATESCATETSYKARTESPIQEVYKKPKKSKKQSKIVVPGYDVKTEARITMGPAESDFAKLTLKVIPRAELDKKMILEEQLDVSFKENIEKEEDIYANEDSDIETDYKQKKIEEDRFKGENEKVKEQERIKEKQEEVEDIQKVDIYANEDSDIETDYKQKIEEEREKIKREQERIKEKLKEVKAKEMKLKDIKEGVQFKKTVEVSERNETKSLILKKRLRLQKEKENEGTDSSFTSNSDTSTKDSSTSIEDIPIKIEDTKDTPKKEDTKDKPKKIEVLQQLDSDEEKSQEIMKKINEEYKIEDNKFNHLLNNEQVVSVADKIHHVNPFKNIDPNISKFIDKLITPILMVHTKNNKRIQPTLEIQDVNFTTYIHVALKNMGVKTPLMPQRVSWFSILRGYSLFMVSPKRSGKTLGYLPAVCRLISDFDSEKFCVGPLCIIVCATAVSVAETERMAKCFLNKNRVLACFVGMDELELTTALLNGCDLLICTPSLLVRLLQMTDFSIDLRRLMTFVLDDAERLSEVYSNEVNFFLLKMRELVKNRANKELAVQFIVSSRVWCNFMEPLVKKAPHPVVCISAFQECVLYSKASTSVTFVTAENKLKSALDFVKTIDNTKKTVIVCRENEEVDKLEAALKEENYIVFSSNDKMTIQDLYQLSSAWNDYQEPLLGPILVCCDVNLQHMNVTDAHYLLHYSLPHLFSLFCRRFAVINDNYASIFKQNNENVKIKVLLEQDNIEQFPKILHFIKRCTSDVPKVLDEICDRVLIEKDETKGDNLVPLCDNLLAFGECPDFWYCHERHSIFKRFDEPKDWVPVKGDISFKILHYHNAAHFSARLLTNTTNGDTVKHKDTYKTLTMKILTHFSKEANRKMHGTPKVGDICAVSLRLNFYVRCEVVKILNRYPRGNPNYVLVNLIDEERLERTRDIYLFHLPEHLKEVDTHVIHVRMANIQPKDKDITYSELAKKQLETITQSNEDLLACGKVKMTIGNCVIVENVETFRELSSTNIPVYRHNFKEELSAHATANPDHIVKLTNLAKELDLPTAEPKIVALKPKKELPKPRWAFLEEMCTVLFASGLNPDTFFIRLVKFEDCINILIKDIQKYVTAASPVTEVAVNDIVIAQLPDDGMYERARIDSVSGNRANCFFVDQGDWRDVFVKHIYPITEKLVSQLPFQAIECRLAGVAPAGEQWTEFSSNWLFNSFEDDTGDLKQLYAKFYLKEKAQYTNGHKYAIALIDTNGDQDVMINSQMVEVNLAKENDEFHLLESIEATNTDTKIEEVERPKSVASSIEDQWVKVKDIPEATQVCAYNNKVPIRSVPLVDSDVDDDEWEMHMTDDFKSMFNMAVPANLRNDTIGVTANAYKTSPNYVGLDAGRMLTDVPHNGSGVSERAKNSTVKVAQILDSSGSDLSAPTEKASEKKNSVRELKIDTSDSENSVQNNSKVTLDSDDITSPDTTMSDRTPIQNAIVTQIDKLRKPRIVWWQTKTNVFCKILLITDDYFLEIKDKWIEFKATANDTAYAFNLELYGVVDKKNTTHSNKGQYIFVSMKKIIKAKWLMLQRDAARKWIVYDVDHIDHSSDEETVIDDTPIKVMKSYLDNNISDSDEDFMDDINFRYKR